MTSDVAGTDPALGLTSSQVAERVAAGQVNTVKDRNARSLGDIVRANTFTYFNALIGSLWVLMLVSAPFIDSLFGFVIVINTAIGVVQEYRAARTLAKLSLVGQQQALVRRDGDDVEVPPASLVLGEIIVIRTGDQMLVDGRVVESRRPRARRVAAHRRGRPGGEGAGRRGALRAASSSRASGHVRATKVGEDSYAASWRTRPAGSASRARSCATAIKLFIKYVSWPSSRSRSSCSCRQFRANDGDIRAAIAGTVAGVVTMVPEGLVLLTSVAFAVAVDHPRAASVPRAGAAGRRGPRPRRRRLPRQDRHAHRGRDGRRRRRPSVDDRCPSHDALGALGRRASPSPTRRWSRSPRSTTAPGRLGGHRDSAVLLARKWSRPRFGDQGSWVIGAPEMVLPDAPDPVRARGDDSPATARACWCWRRSAGGPTAEHWPAACDPPRSSSQRRQLRPTRPRPSPTSRPGRTAQGDLRRQPRTVGAVAAQAGIPGADSPYDARELPRRPRRAGRRARGALGVRPGDPAPEAGDGRRAAAARPRRRDDRRRRQRRARAEGRRPRHRDGLRCGGDEVGGADRAARRRLRGHALGRGRRPAGARQHRAGLGPLPDQDASTRRSSRSPRSCSPGRSRSSPAPHGGHSLTIGTPAFFLALLPNKQRFRPGFFRRVLKFAVPAGLINAVSAYVTYGYVLSLDYDVEVTRSSAVVTLFIVAWWVLVQVARPINLIRGAIVGAMLVCFLGVLYIPWLSNMFQLSWSPDVPGLGRPRRGRGRLRGRERRPRVRRPRQARPRGRRTGPRPEPGGRGGPRRRRMRA